MNESAKGNRPKTFDVCVKNYPLDVSDDDVRSVFNQFGKIASTMIKDDNNRPDVKFGYVRFYKEEDANRAISEQNLTLGGNKLLLSLGQKAKRDGLTGPRGPAGDMKPQMGGSRPWNNKPDIVSTTQPARNMNTGYDMNIDALKSSKREEIFVSSVESPCVFWAQSTLDSGSLAEISHNMATTCASGKSVCGPPQKNKVYGAPFSLDNMWYRCKVEEYVGETQTMVRFIDYGNCEVIQNHLIMELLPKVISAKPLAHKYGLHGLVNSYDKEDMGYQQGIDKLKELIEQKAVNAMLGARGGDLTYVMAEANGMDVNQFMLDNGFCQRRTSKPGSRDQQDGGRKDYEGQRSGFRSRDQQQDNMQGFNRGQATRFNPNKDMGNQGFQNQLNSQGGKRSFKINAGNANNHWDSPETMQHMQMSSLFDGPRAFQQQEEPTIDMWDAGNPNPAPSPSPPVQMNHAPMYPNLMQPPPPPPSPDLSKMQNELQNSQSEVMRLRSELSKKQTQMNFMEQENSMVLLDHAKLKGELRNLTQECENMKHQFQELSLTHRLRTLLINVQKVKQLRLQFPTERQTRDNIEWAIELVKNSKRNLSADDLEVTAKVTAAMNKYHTSQETIKCSQKLSELEDLIAIRDADRKDLHSSLVEFEETVSGLPLNEKKSQFSSALQFLESTHSAFLRPELSETIQLAEALDWYNSWKTRKTALFREKRALTNACHNSLNGSLNSLQQELALDIEQCGDNTMGAANVDEPLKKYNLAVTNEIIATDIERSDEASFVTLVLKTLVGEIRTQLSHVETLVTMQSQFSLLARKIRQWLVEKPNVAILSGIRKEIKGLKSKLRHKLADKQDMEESDEIENEELKTIESDLQEIRGDLQEAFKKEDDQLAYLSNLSENHFPELDLQHSDIGIDNEIEYNGLVKNNRSLEYFETRPLPGCDKSSILKSSFCKEQVVIKEYIVDDSLGVRKSDFLRRAMAYHHISHPSILPLEAVFFVKGKRNAYVQMPFYENSVHSLISQEQLPSQTVHDVLSGVLQGLKCLHDSKLVHGAVHPNNIFLNREGKGVLADFDFTKSLQQRAERDYTTQNGLRFASPEVLNSGQITRASDIFNFGLLALWLLKPSAHIAMRTNGIPDLENVSIGSSTVTSFIRIVLNENPSARPSSTELLTFSYFVQCPESPRTSPREELTLQLRPKQPSPPAGEKLHSGILKNASPASTPPPIDSLPHLALKHPDVHGNMDQEVAKILTSEPVEGILPPDIVAILSPPPETAEMTASPATSDGAPPLEPIDDEQDEEEEDEEVKFMVNSCSAPLRLGEPCAADRGEEAAPSSGKAASLGVPDISVQMPTPCTSPAPPALESASEAHGNDDESEEQQTPQDVETTEDGNSTRDGDLEDNAGPTANEGLTGDGGSTGDQGIEE